MSLKQQMYTTFTCMFAIIVLYTWLAYTNLKRPKIYAKRDKRRKHAALKALLEEKRRKNET